MTTASGPHGHTMTGDEVDGGLTVVSDASSGPVAVERAGDEPATPDDDLIATLNSLRELGRFGQGAALVREIDAHGPAEQLGAAAHAAAGRAMVAVSDYPTAAAHLALASMDTAHAVAALAGLSELAWIRHEHDRGAGLARAGLALDPSHHGCRTLLERHERGVVAAAAPGPHTVSHAAFFADHQGNAGDRALTDAVRRCFTGVGGVTGPDHPGWNEVHVHQLFDERRLEAVNATAGLVVGGGGLFLPDTAPNGNSGWQWNVPDDVLARIEVPLVVFAVGYNMFAGQTFDTGDTGAGAGRFAQSLRTLVDRSTFMGLRNHGSVNRVRELLPSDLADRVVWQPCPTTFAGLFEARDAVPRRKEPYVLLNCAFDRAGRRFGDRYGAFLAGLRDWVLHTRRRADVRFAAHCVDDQRFVSDLRREHGITLPVVPVYDLGPTAIQDLYRDCSLAVGMRGHASMIPFGVGTPILSLISHPKLGYFLADIDRPQWGLDVQDPQLGPKLSELTTSILDDVPGVSADIVTLRARLVAVTDANLRSLPASMRPTARIGQDQPGE